MLRILVELGHPAHVHFFRHPIRLWRERGHHVLLVTRDKEITHALLDEYGLEYLPLSKQKNHLLSQMVELIIRWIKIFWIIKRQKIDVAISISGISTAVPAKLAGIVSITDTDSESARLSNKIAFPFSDVVLTPTSFLHQATIKNIESYNSFHELAYLHPNRFTPEFKYIERFHLTKDDKFLVIRLVKWKAVHDIHGQGISEAQLDKIIQWATSHQHKVVLSSERPLPSKFDSYRIQGNFSHIFHLLAFSNGYIGESPTMAMEAAILGSPSVFISSIAPCLGYTKEMQKKYGLLHIFETFEAAFPFITQHFLSTRLRDEIALKQKKLFEEKIDISEWITQFVIDYVTRDSRHQK